MILQIKHGQSCETATDILTQTTQEWNFKKNQEFRIPSVNTVCHGSESTSCQGSKNWEFVPVKINEFISLSSFEKEIRNYVPQSYPWRLRKQYISAADCLVVFFTFKVLAL